MDIGDLDCTIHVGFPGSVCSLRQQAGRCGRNGRPSVSVLVALDSVRGSFRQHTRSNAVL